LDSVLEEREREIISDAKARHVDSSVIAIINNMALSLRVRPRPGASNGDDNDEMLLAEQKLLTLSSLEARREEKRRRMEEVFQEITVLQMEMKELEGELGILDQDIEQMEDEIQQTSSSSSKSAAAAAAAALKTNAAAPAAMTATTQTQMDEILTDPTAAATQATTTSPLPSSSSSPTTTMMLTSILPSQEQLTEPTDERSPLLPQQQQQRQQRHNTSSSSSLVSTSAGSCSSTTHELPVAALVRQLQLTTNTATAAATTTTTTLSRKKTPPAASSSSSSSSILHASAPGAAAAPPRLQQQHHQSSPYSHDQFPWSHKVSDLLHNTFRIPSFRDYQKEIINATLSGQDVFVLMRTGGGKSLTYQLPALLEGRSSSASASKNKVTLCISPLLSLIQDQEEQMNAYCPGSALSFTSGLAGCQTEQARRWNLVRDASAGVCLIFVTPEKVHKSNKLRNELQKLHDAHRLGRFVIDEAHCASQWGSDFRPDYAQLGILKRHFPDVPVLAVTATASQRVRNDVCRILGLCSPISPSAASLALGNNTVRSGAANTTTKVRGRPYCFFRSTAHRPNLTYSVRTKVDGKDAVIVDMVAFIKERYSAQNGGSARKNAAGIVYTLSRKDADQVASKLCDYGIVARPYHSEVSPTQKQAIHASWMKNQTQVVVATIAFGYVPGTVVAAFFSK
jgi:superfamily II DNA/RNA helicase